MEISIRVKCAHGGELVRKGLQYDHEESDLVVLVEPCPVCIREANDNGYQDGADEAKKVLRRDK